MIGFHVRERMIGFSDSAECLQESLAGILQQVEYQFEALCATVIGVGHVVSLGMAVAVVGHPVYLG